MPTLLNNKRKKSLLFFLIILLIICVISCVLMNRYPVGRLFVSLGLSAKTPYNYPGSVWRSSEPEITLFVSDKPNATIEESHAYISIDGTIQPVLFVVDSTQSMVCISKGGIVLIEGEIISVNNKILTFSARINNTSIELDSEITLTRDA